MPNTKPKVLFVTGLYAPFQLDVVYEVNKLGLFEYHIAFAVPYAARRGSHWLVNIKDEYAKYIKVADGEISAEERALWAADVISKIAPQIVISGFYKGPLGKPIVKAARTVDAKLAFWLEPLDCRYPKLIEKIYQHLVLKGKFRDAQFILGIGEKAVETYKKVFPGEVYLVPYTQDLSVHFNIPRKPIPDNKEVTFLFSGQLVKRHNIRLIARALVQLYKKYPREFKFVIAGRGTEEGAFMQIIMKQPSLKEQIIIDRDYKTWEDRVRPFSYSDVLLYPSSYAGWGLVVPEAMAAGMAVISTFEVESARYYIKNGVNGIIIKATPQQLFASMEWCVKNKGKIYEIGQHARDDIRKGTAEYVAGKFCEIMQRYLR